MTKKEKLERKINWEFVMINGRFDRNVLRKAEKLNHQYNIDSTLGTTLCVICEGKGRQAVYHIYPKGGQMKGINYKKGEGAGVETINFDSNIIQLFFDRSYIYIHKNPLTSQENEDEKPENINTI